ncbi:hypothetical protein [Streptomyces sp. KL2]
MRDGTVPVGGVRLGRGGRVRLRPSPGSWWPESATSLVRYMRIRAM